jgi:uracil-DNA glycosylase
MNYSQDINLKSLIPKAWLHYIDINLVDKLENSLRTEIKTHSNSYFFPYNPEDIFKIFHLCNPEDIKVVILGQDPYHSSKFQANGIAFSVNKKVAIPPSLRNIFKELNIKPSHGDLESWVKQGVFLLNASLTVKEKSPNTHETIWNHFITHIIDIINKKCDNIIFVGWGNFAVKRYSILNLNKHTLLSSSHPSPLSCYKTDNPFIGSNIFTKINEILESSDRSTINWTLLDD